MPQGKGTYGSKVGRPKIKGMASDKDMAFLKKNKPKKSKGN